MTPSVRDLLSGPWVTDGTNPMEPGVYQADLHSIPPIDHDVYRAYFDGVKWGWVVREQLGKGPYTHYIENPTKRHKTMAAWRTLPPIGEEQPLSE
jgi:hypothetical protein